MKITRMETRWHCTLELFLRRPFGKAGSLPKECIPRRRRTFFQSSVLAPVWLTVLCASPSFEMRAWAQSPYLYVVSPGIYENSEADSWNVGPFGRRFQQVYDATDFQEISNGGWISEMQFRLDSPDANGGMGMTWSNVQINLSTTTVTPFGPNQIKNTFSLNVGSDDTVVLGPRPLSVSAPESVGEPQPFYIQVSFDRPFFYSPANGNLLLDVRTVGGSTGVNKFYDASQRTDDSIACVAWAQGSDFGFSEPALVTRFFVTRVPEPSTWTLLLIGASGLVYWHRRKGR